MDELSAESNLGSCSLSTVLITHNKTSYAEMFYSLDKALDERIVS